MAYVYFISHPDVQIIPDIDIKLWGLSEKGKERTEKLLAQPWLQDISQLFSSTETKAIETAQIISSHIDLPFTQIDELSEMDRSSTGFLPREEFERTADEFFAHPDRSVRGWETALDAQTRIVKAIEQIILQSHDVATIAIVSHGGVGALLLAKLSNTPISRSFDQPGEGGGNYFVFDSITREILSGWKPFEEEKSI